MAKWEYLTQSFTARELRNIIGVPNKHGQDGWEMISLVPLETTHFPRRRFGADKSPITEYVTAYVGFFKRGGKRASKPPMELKG